MSARSPRLTLSLAAAALVGAAALPATGLRAQAPTGQPGQGPPARPGAETPLIVVPTTEPAPGSAPTAGAPGTPTPAPVQLPALPSDEAARPTAAGAGSSGRGGAPGAPGPTLTSLVNQATAAAAGQGTRAARAGATGGATAGTGTRVRRIVRRPRLADGMTVDVRDPAGESRVVRGPSVVAMDPAYAFVRPVTTGGRLGREDTVTAGVVTYRAGTRVRYVFDALPGWTVRGAFAHDNGQSVRVLPAEGQVTLGAHTVLEPDVVAAADAVAEPTDGTEIPRIAGPRAAEPVGHRPPTTRRRHARHHAPARPRVAGGSPTVAAPTVAAPTGSVPPRGPTPHRKS